MSFGLPASFSQYIPLNNLSKAAFQYAAIRTFEKLNWAVIAINEDLLIAETNQMNSTWNEKITVDFSLDDPLLISSSNGNQIYDRGRNKKNTEFFFDEFNEARKEVTQTDEGKDAKEKLLARTKENCKLNNREERSVTEFYSVFSIFIPTSQYLITPLLLLANILVFFSMFFSGVHFFSPAILDLIHWGANYGPLTTDGDWWRLITSVFVHIGFIHLVANCYALAYVGLFLESHLKKIGFLSLYLFCGILASLSSLYWNEDLVCAGASGAIFGMYGILLVLIITKEIRQKLSTNTKFFIVFFIVINLLYSFEEGTDGAAHFGGFFAGIVFGSLYAYFKTKRNNALVFATLLTFILAPAISIYCKSKKIYIYQIIEYETKMQEFVDMEKMALEAYSIDYNSTKEDVLYMIKERGIYYWEEDIKLIKELDKLYLPKKIHDINKQLALYCELRKQVYELAYKKINENTSMYDGPIGSLNNKITDLLEEIAKSQKE
ncbi:rhomboid family intramembrane serine protease [Flavobacterium sp.]|uniref:rhomboid family intramembrane serine protease n=1 Tax=Flavobacterium sp. TaxID=239 RepID=UPI00262A9877|nr:rhomboid family intramembrane serine protease [Flavobacterium sp.]MDG2431683.1 rhomboid family intramembrane serine protease [Flavobacterium sp.]